DRVGRGCTRCPAVPGSPLVDVRPVRAGPAHGDVVGDADLDPRLERLYRLVRRGPLRPRPPHHGGPSFPPRPCSPSPLQIGPGAAVRGLLGLAASGALDGIPALDAGLDGPGILPARPGLA